MSRGRDVRSDLSDEGKYMTWLQKREFFHKLFKKVYPDREIGEIHIKEGKFKPYDMEIYFTDNSMITVEVKLDKATVKWGNALIEYESSFNPSGIETTEADYWLHLMISQKYKGNLTATLMHTNELRELIKNNNFNTAACGDYSKELGMNVARGHRIPEEEIYAINCIDKPMKAKSSTFFQETGIKPYDPQRYKASRYY